MQSRRKFCATTVMAFGGLLLSGQAASQSETVSVSGTVKSAVGRSLKDSHVVFVHQGTIEWYRADIGSDGEFTVSLPTGAEYYLVFFDQEPGDLINPEFDGVPIIADLDEVSVDGVTDLGGYTVPEAHVATIRVKNPNGNPLQNVPLSFRVPSGNGTGPGGYTTDENGYVTHVENDRSGVELAGSVTVETHPPGGGGAILDNLFVDEDTRVTTVLRNQDEYNGVIEREDTEGTGTPEIIEQTDDPNTTQDPTDGDQSVADRSSVDSSQRGFLSNGADEPAALSDPMNLTVGGFVLSVAGILYQLVGGS